MAFSSVDIFIALLTAHLLADFVFQTTDMVLRKHRWLVMLMHGMQVFALTVLFTGGSWALGAAIALSHVAIDAIKVHLAGDTLRSYLSDQAAHLLILAAVAVWLPLEYYGLHWPMLPPAGLRTALIVSGLVGATLAGGPAVGHMMQRYKEAAQPQGLENAGRIIGLMERGLIFLMVMIGEPTSIGFLIAAKSILRFDTVSKDQKISEYVIIGTLASFGWALAVSFATIAALSSLGY